MRWSTGTVAPSRARADLLVVGVESRDDRPALEPWRELDRASGGLADLADGRIFAGGDGQFHLLPGGKAAAAWVLAVGLGKSDEITPQSLRKALAAASRRASDLGARSCALALPWDALDALTVEAVARCCVEGAELAQFRTGTEKAKTGRDEKPAPRAWKILAPHAKRTAEVRRGLASGEAYAAGCLFARELVNRPPNKLTPAALANAARAMARREDLGCTVLGEPRLRKLGMGGILGVGRGSAQPSRLIVLEMRPRRVRGKLPLVALVGKGVTFDTGGISIKPSPNMHEMKGDMGGAAAVLGAAMIVARLALPVRLLVVVPAVENMPDGDAIRPGDVLRMASGKTVEVLNTDAEGRLILADALHYAGRRKPDWMIDAATLTGSCVIALGHEFAGLFTNDARLGDVLQRAGGETFERVWPLPVVEEHHKEIESPVADIQNIGGRHAGASSAAAFLEEFVGDETAWAHLDIAGPAWAATASPLGPKGPTGFGARLIARAVESLTREA
jgi:leucyl aminopeptidase